MTNTKTPTPFFATKLALAITLEALFAVVRLEAPRVLNKALPDTPAERRAFYEYVRAWLAEQEDPGAALKGLVHGAAAAAEEYRTGAC